MRKLILLGLIATSLSACLGNDPERALAGAATGAVIATATGGDLLMGAAIGAGTGALCDDLRVCR